MPAFARQDEPGIALRVGGTLDLLQSLVEDALIQRLTLGVERLELLGQGRGFCRIVTQEEPEPVGSVCPLGRPR